MVLLANVNINCGNPECNRQMLASVENEEKHLGSCSVACAKHPHNRYVKEKENLTTEEINAHLAAFV